MKKSFIILSIFTALISSCAFEDEKKESGNIIAQKETETKTSEVPYTPAKNYFVKNTFVPDQLLGNKITSRENFDQIFGMAATMGEAGKPTAIDFSNQYAIAVIDSVTNNTTELIVKSLTHENSTIVLNYAANVGSQQSFSTRPFLLLIVDNTHSGDVKVHKN